jgi:hypothetical protein
LDFWVVAIPPKNPLLHKLYRNYKCKRKNVGGAV